MLVNNQEISREYPLPSLGDMTGTFKLHFSTFKETYGRVHGGQVLVCLVSITEKSVELQAKELLVEVHSMLEEQVWTKRLVSGSCRMGAGDIASER